MVFFLFFQVCYYCQDLIIISQIFNFLLPAEWHAVTFICLHYQSICATHLIYLHTSNKKLEPAGTRSSSKVWISTDRTVSQIPQLCIYLFVLLPAATTYSMTRLKGSLKEAHTNICCSKDTRSGSQLPPLLFLSFITFSSWSILWSIRYLFEASLWRYKC